MKKDHYGQNPVLFTRHFFRKPHKQAGDEQNECAEEHDPPELFLAGIEAALWWHLLIFILDVMLYVFIPFLIFGNGLHVALPLPVHPQDGEEIHQSYPGMAIANGART